MAETSHSEPAGEELSQANIISEQPVYEVGFHIVPTVGEEGVGGVLESIRAALGTGSAEIIKEEYPQKKALAYTVERAAQGKREKYTESYFGFIKFAMDKSAVQQFIADLRANNNILRYLVIETVREDIVAPRRAVFSSDRLEGETIKKPAAVEEPKGEVSEDELNKSIDALVS